MTTQIAVRLPDDDLARLDNLIPRLYVSRAEAVRAAVHELIVRQREVEHEAGYSTLPQDDEELGPLLAMQKAGFSAWADDNPW